MDTIGVMRYNKSISLKYIWIQIVSICVYKKLMVQWKPKIISIQQWETQKSNFLEIIKHTFNYHYNDIIISSQFTGISTVCLTVCPPEHIQVNINTPRHWPLWGNPPVIDGFPTYGRNSAFLSICVTYPLWLFSLMSLCDRKKEIVISSNLYKQSYSAFSRSHMLS